MNEEINTSPSTKQKDVSPKLSSKSALSSYFTSQSMSEDIFDTVFKQDVFEPNNDSSTAFVMNTQPVKPDLVKDAATLKRLRQRDAWLPSEATRQSLCLTADVALCSTVIKEIKPTLSKPEVELSTFSGAATLCDPYRTVLLQYLQDEASVMAVRRVPNPSEQTVHSTESLKELVTNGWYHAALDVTRRLLTNWGYVEEQGGAVLTPLTAQVWLTRLALLVRVRNYQLAQTELMSFQSLDAPNLYFEHSPDLYPGRFGSIIPFSLRLLHAELPFHLGRTEEALDRLYYLLAVIARMRCNLQKGYTEDGSATQPEPGYGESSLSLWACREVRVLSSCLSIYLSELDYMAAIETLHRLALTCSGDPAVVRGLANVLGRVYMQMGDLETAKSYFNRACPIGDPNKQPTLTTQQVFQKALLSIGKGDYEEAKKLFQKVLVLDPTNVAAANNMVVCSLYLGQLSGAIRVLDTLTTTGLSGQQPLDTASRSDSSGVTDAPQSASDSSFQRRRFCLHDALICNLAVLYEVESDGATTKKVKLLQRLAGLPGEPVHISAFKLQATA